MVVAASLAFVFYPWTVTCARRAELSVDTKEELPRHVDSPPSPPCCGLGDHGRWLCFLSPSVFAHRKLARHLEQRNLGTSGTAESPHSAGRSRHLPSGFCRTIRPSSPVRLSGKTGTCSGKLPLLHEHATIAAAGQLSNDGNGRSDKLSRRIPRAQGSRHVRDVTSMRRGAPARRR